MAERFASNPSAVAKASGCRPRRDFVEAVALDRDPQKLAEATDYLEAHQDRYADLETRMAALSERCAGDPAVQAAFLGMESP